MTESPTTPSGPPSPPPPPPPPQPGAGSTGPTYPAGAYAGDRPPQAHFMPRLWAGLRGTGLRRSPNRILGGVCGGIADRTGLDPTFVRVVMVIVALFSGVGTLAYGLAWLLLPEPDGRIHAEQALKWDIHVGTVGAIAFILVALGGGGGWGWWGGWGWSHHGPFGLLWRLIGAAVSIAVVVLIIYAISQSRSAAAQTSSFRTAEPAASQGPPPPAPPSGPTSPPAPWQPESYLPAQATKAPGRKRRRTLGGFGLLIAIGAAIVAGVVGDELGRHGHLGGDAAAIGWSFALAAVALTIIGAGLIGRRSGVLTLVALVTLVGALVAATVPRMHDLQGSGDRTWSPTSMSQAADGYGLGAGDARLDLTTLSLAAGDGTTPTIPVSVGFGRLTVIVPATMSVQIDSQVGGGDVLVVPEDGSVRPGTSSTFIGSDEGWHRSDGMGIKRTDTVLGTGPIEAVLDANVGFGEIRIETSGSTR